MIGGLTCIALMFFFLETCKSMDLSVKTNDSLRKKQYNLLNGQYL